MIVAAAVAIVAVEHAAKTPVGDVVVIVEHAAVALCFCRYHPALRTVVHLDDEDDNVDLDDEFADERADEDDRKDRIDDLDGEVDDNVDLNDFDGDVVVVVDDFRESSTFYGLIAAVDDSLMAEKVDERLNMDKRKKPVVVAAVDVVETVVSPSTKVVEENWILATSDCDVARTLSSRKTSMKLWMLPPVSR